MKFILAIFLAWGFSTAFSQTIIYDGNGNVIGGTHIRTRPPEKVILVDTSTNNRFVLDTAHITITAYSKTGAVLWKTDPWKDNKIDVYRTNRPIIVNIVFGKDPGYIDKSQKGERVIMIEYINTQFGYIDLKTGKFHFMGQD
jgi:hypothetical protein